jgi:pilus assembly protein Flp/PilA
MKNQRGQSLIEYLVIVSIIAIGSIAIVRSLGETVYVRFANITNALQNKNEEISLSAPSKNEYKKKGLDDFFKQE